MQRLQNFGKPFSSKDPFHNANHSLFKLKTPLQVDSSLPR